MAVAVEAAHPMELWIVSQISPQEAAAVVVVAAGVEGEVEVEVEALHFQ